MERQYTVYKTFEKDPLGRQVAILSAISAQNTCIFRWWRNFRRHGGRRPGRVEVWIRDFRQRQRTSQREMRWSRVRGIFTACDRRGTLQGAPSLLSGPLTDAAKEQLSTERFAAFEKARDATLAAMAQTKKFIDDHAASWPENYAMGHDAYNAMLRDEELLPDLIRTRSNVSGATNWRAGWAVQIWMEQLAKRARHTNGSSEAAAGLRREVPRC